MSLFAGYRAFNRSQTVRVGGKELSPTTTTWLNLDNKRVQRDIGRHSSIGGLHQVSGAVIVNTGGYVENGGVVTVSGATASSTAVAGRLNSGAVFTHTADTTTVGGPDATNPKADTVFIDDADGTPNLDDSTVAAAATTNAELLNGLGAVGADDIPLAAIYWPAAIATTTGLTGVAATGVFTTGGAHGLAVGDSVNLFAQTGASAGLTPGNYVVATVPTSTTFTLVGVASWTGNVTAGTLVRPPTIVDLR